MEAAPRESTPRDYPSRAGRLRSGSTASVASGRASNSHRAPRSGPCREPTASRREAPAAPSSARTPRRPGTGARRGRPRRRHSRGLPAAATRAVSRPSGKYARSTTCMPPWGTHDQLFLDRRRVDQDLELHRQTAANRARDDSPSSPPRRPAPAPRRRRAAPPGSEHEGAAAAASICAVTASPSVDAPVTRSSSKTSVFTDPAARAMSSSSSHRGITACLWGIVTFAPGEAHRPQAHAPHRRAARSASAAARTPSRARARRRRRSASAAKASGPSASRAGRRASSCRGSRSRDDRILGRARNSASPEYLPGGSTAGVAVLAHLAQKLPLARREEVPFRPGDADVVEVVDRRRMSSRPDRGDAGIRDRRRRQAREPTAVVGVVARDRGLREGPVPGMSSP